MAALARAFRANRQTIDLDEILADAWKAGADHTAQAPILFISKALPATTLPVRSRPLPTSERTSDSLEQALGYAIQAFRDYLNARVVDPVELIYFLSYDVWDGCLVYDGLVRGSIEQRLINFIRKQFLDRDHLRSRYEKLAATGRSTDLGAAGACFHAALSNPADSLSAITYIGDLSAQASEYRQYDTLLGLRSCLYIPIVGDRLSPVHDGPGHRQPLGGVLMAACRTPSRLVPRATQAHAKWREATAFRDGITTSSKNAAQQLLDFDREISHKLRQKRCIGEKVRPQRISRLSHKIESFLCIALVASIPGALNSGRSFERAIHPSFLKSAAKALKGGTTYEKQS